MPTIRLGILTPRAILYSLNLSISLFCNVAALIRRCIYAYTHNYMQKHFLRYIMTVGYKSGMNSKHRSTLYRQLAMELLVQRVERLQVYSAAFVKRQKIVAAIDFGTCNTKIAFAYKPLTNGRDARVVVMDAWENAPAAVMY